MDKIHVLGIAGSLREHSYNRAFLRAALEALPDDMTLEIYDLKDIPLYNNEIEGENDPQAVVDFKARIAAADALLFVTPEYNHSIPGVLKNAIDWVSRPPAQSPLSDKPAAITGVSTGPWGTVRAQLHLRQVLACTNTLVMTGPMVYVNHAKEKFDEQGCLTDERAREHLNLLLSALGRWTRRLGK